MYRKKTVLLCSVISPSSKPVGIAVFVCDGKKTSVRLSINGVAKQSCYFVAQTDEVAVSNQISSLQSFEFCMPPSLLEKVTCLLMDGRCQPLCFGSSKGFVLTAEFLAKAKSIVEKDTKSKKEQGQKSESSASKGQSLSEVLSTAETEETKQMPADVLAIPQESAIMTPTVSPSSPPIGLDFEGAYDSFVVATNNYYGDVKMLAEEKLSQAKLSLSQYAKALEEYYDKKKAGNYLKSVGKELEKVFESYHPYLPLMRKIEDSFFVKITDGRDNFFALGLLQEENQPKYICYALPQKTPREDSFLSVKVQDGEAGVAFGLILQSVEDGKVFKAR